MFAIFKKELRYFFSTPIAYIAIGFFWLAISLFLWTIPGYWNIADTGYANVDGLFEITPWLFIILCPALSMHLFADEKQTGNWDILLTKSLKINQIVTGKFFAVWLVMLIAILPNCGHYFIVFRLAEPVGNIDGAQFWGAFLGLILLSATCLSVSLVGASLTNSQIVAFIISAILCFTLEWTMFKSHFDSLARGVIDMQDIVFFLSITILCLCCASFIAKIKSYRG